MPVVIVSRIIMTKQALPWHCFDRLKKKHQYTCKILSCAAGVWGVRRAMLLLVTLYSESRALEAELVIPDSSAVWRAISLAWPSFTTSSSSTSDIWPREQSCINLYNQPYVKQTNKNKHLSKIKRFTCGAGSTSLLLFLVNSDTPLVCKMAEGRSDSFFFLIFCLSFLRSRSSFSL